MQVPLEVPCLVALFRMIRHRTLELSGRSMRILSRRFRGCLSRKRFEFARNKTVSDLARDCRAARGLAVALPLERRRWSFLHVDDFGNDLIEALSFDELHRVKVSAVVLADVENGHDIRVVQAGRHARLALK